MKSPKKFWDKVAPRYAKSPVRDEKSYQQKLAVTQSYFRPEWSVFEFGCGTGSTALAQRLGLAPYLRYFSKNELVAMFTHAGFTIDYQW